MYTGQMQLKWDMSVYYSGIHFPQRNKNWIEQSFLSGHDVCYDKTTCLQWPIKEWVVLNDHCQP